MGLRYAASIVAAVVAAAGLVAAAHALTLYVARPDPRFIAIAAAGQWEALTVARSRVDDANKIASIYVPRIQAAQDPAEKERLREEMRARFDALMHPERYMRHENSRRDMRHAGAPVVDGQR